MSAVADVLCAVEPHARIDERGPRKAVAGLWQRLHSESYARGDATLMGDVFGAVRQEAGCSQEYLGNVLRHRTAAERADILLRAAEAAA